MVGYFFTVEKSIVGNYFSFIYYMKTDKNAKLRTKNKIHRY